MKSFKWALPQKRGKSKEQEEKVKRKTAAEKLKESEVRQKIGQNAYTVLDPAEAVASMQASVLKWESEVYAGTMARLWVLRVMHSQLSARTTWRWRVHTLDDHSAPTVHPPLLDNTLCAAPSELSPSTAAADASATAPAVGSPRVLQLAGPESALQTPSHLPGAADSHQVCCETRAPTNHGSCARELNDWPASGSCHASL